MRGIHRLEFPLKLSCPLVFFRCDVILLVTYCLAGESPGSVSPSTIESTGKKWCQDRNFRLVVSSSVDQPSAWFKMPLRQIVQIVALGYLCRLVYGSLDR